jgi:hypothetical protein
LWQTTPALSEGTAGAASAVEDLCRAAREDIQTRGWLPERAADCLARCCLFVLAYARVSPRGRQGAPAYWKHLRDLLAPFDTHAKDHLGPFGLDQPTFQELWARTREEFRLELPKPNTADCRRWRGQLCNVEIVRSQAGLRQLDLARVQAMFADCRGQHWAKSASAGEIYAWLEERKHRLTPYAQRVLMRNPEVARRQILGEWQRHQSISAEPVLVTEPSSTPPRDLQALRTDKSPLYLQLDERCGQLIAYRGDESLRAEPLAFELRKLRNHVWTFDELYERFHPERSAAPGERVLLFLDEQPSSAVLDALTELSDTLRCWRPAHLEGLPAGWMLVYCRNLRRPRSTNVFSWVLAALELQGGLPIERGRWLLGAGPVAILQGDLELEVNGEAWPVEDGRADLSTLTSGRHEIRYGGRVERFEIVPGRRVIVTGSSSRWVWPSGSGWPELTDRTAGALRSLDGCLFIQVPTQPDTDLASDAGHLDFAIACRRSPTVEDVGRAHAGPQGEVLGFAAVARGRA